MVFRGDVSNCDQLTVPKLEACLEIWDRYGDGMRNVNCGSLSVEAATQTLGRIAGDVVPTSGPCVDVDIAMCPGLFAMGGETDDADITEEGEGNDGAHSPADGE